MSGRTGRPPRQRLCAVVAAGLVLLLSGCGGQSAPAPPAAAAPSAASQAEPLQRYLGKQVTLVGTVGQVYSEGAVTVVLGGASNGDPGEGNTKQQALLVLSKSSIGVQSGSSVQLTGTLLPGFSAQAAQRYGASFPEGALGDAYNGQPYIEAVFVAPKISANVTTGGDGGFSGSGIASLGTTAAGTSSDKQDTTRPDSGGPGGGSGSTGDSGSSGSGGSGGSTGGGSTGGGGSGGGGSGSGGSGG